MTGPGTSPEPHRGAFDPDEASIVLRRAIELAADREQQAVGEALTGEDLAEVAQQAGIPAPALAAAVAEARAGLTQERSIVDRLIGPAKVSASTHLTDDEAAAAASLQRWFEVEHGLSAYVRQDGVVIASRRGGLPGAVGSGVRRVQGTGGLARVRSVRAGTAAADDGGGVICVVADISNRRNEAVAGGTAVTGSGAAVIGIVALVAGPVALVALPAAIAAGLGTARLAHRRTITQVEEQVAHTTEAAAKNEAPTTPAKRLLPGRLGGRKGGRGDSR